MTVPLLIFSDGETYFCSANRTKHPKNLLYNLNWIFSFQEQGKTTKIRKKNLLKGSGAFSQGGCFFSS